MRVLLLLQYRDHQGKRFLASLLMAECMGSIHPQHRPYLTGLSFVTVSQTRYVSTSHSIDLAYSYVLQSILLLAEGR